MDETKKLGKLLKKELEQIYKSQKTIKSKESELLQSYANMYRHCRINYNEDYNELFEEIIVNRLYNIQKTTGTKGWIKNTIPIIIGVISIKGGFIKLGLMLIACNTLYNFYAKFILSPKKEILYQYEIEVINKFIES